MGTRSKKNVPLGGVPACGDYQGSLGSSIQGMIDGHAQFNAIDTHPRPLLYCDSENKCSEAKKLLASTSFPDNANINLATEKIGTRLVELNSTTFDYDRRDIPTLIIAKTMDMEFAHIDGYEGNPIYQSGEKPNQVFFKNYGRRPVSLNPDEARTLQIWEQQIYDTEKAVASNPLRLFPMFCYDPRRYSKDSAGNSDCRPWDEPFSRIATDKNSGVWLGFYMHPSLGFRPFDEKCKHLDEFYKKCVGNNIPILANCAPDGIITHDAESYQIFDVINNRFGEPSGLGIEYFHRNYGHPDSWRPILETKGCEKLRLCLAHFGGSEWKHESMNVWADAKCDELPPRTWIKSIIELTRDYNNVYTDVSGIDIDNSQVETVFRRILTLIKENKKDFVHLKDKLIFGTDWYFRCLRSKTSYFEYCNKYKCIFDDIDSTLWERVSLINPLNCYSLSKEKFNNIYNNLPKSTEAETTLAKLCKLSEYAANNKPQSSISKKDGGSGQAGKIEPKCICKIKRPIITNVHRELGCKHYEEIRRLINKSRSDGILSENGLYLFNSMESGMSVIKNASFKYANDEDCVNARDNVYAREKNYDRPWGGVCFNRRAYGEIESECGKLNGKCVKIENECRKIEYPCASGCERRENYSFNAYGIFTNLDDDSMGKITYNSKEERLQSDYAYQSTIHELWHAIDFLLGKRRVRENPKTKIDEIVPYPYSFLYENERLIDAFKTDRKNIDKKYGGTYGDAMYKFYNDIRDRCFYRGLDFNEKIEGIKDNECIYPFDIIEGIEYLLGSKNFKSPWTSRYEYWFNGETRILATEYFAAVGCMAAAGNQKGLMLLNNYFPESYNVYTTMINVAAEAIKTKNISLLYPS
jgi:predicted TIM-barrel fold metal-dependent hydrolase